jgi:hypothetical protein
MTRLPPKSLARAVCAGVSNSPAGFIRKFVLIAKQNSSLLGERRECLYRESVTYPQDGGSLMAQHRWNRRFLESWDTPPDNLLYFEPDLRRRRRNAKRKRDEEPAEEIDRSGSSRHLERAAKRLKHINAVDRVLYVPQWDMPKAEQAMRKAGVIGAVSNLCGSKRRLVRASRGR